MLKLLFLGLALGFLLLYLKNVNSEIFGLALIGSGILIIFFSLNYIKDTFIFFNKIVYYTGIKEEYYFLIIKMIAISYLAEFTCSSLDDMGLKSLSDKVIFCSKIIIFSMTIPILNEVFNLVFNALQ